jgi:hypothetical protein
MLVGFISPQAASAATGRCMSGFGSKTPALLVHGWTGDREDWTKGQPSMYDALSRSSKIALDRFDYKPVNDQWVTNPAIGPKLAAHIDCLSRASVRGGGNGKVIVVAHSMGGLAARFAANQTVSGRSVADELGLVITLGTPHEGTLLANAGTSLLTGLCQGAVGNLTFNPLLGLMMDKEACLQNLAIKGLSQDSHEMRSLLRFPTQVPVKAIAGHVSTKVDIFFSKVDVDTKSDTVVGVDSATVEYTDKGVGDGRVVFDCEGDLRQKLPCMHTELPSASYVQAEVKASIEKYLASIKPKPAPKPSATGKAYTMFGMTLRLDPQWTVRGDESIGTTIATNCSGDPCPQLAISSVDWLGSQSVGTMGDLPECSGGESTHGSLVGKGTRAIGNKSATYFEAELCAPGIPSETMRVWEIRGDKHLMLTSTESSGFRVSNLDAILASASWN